MYSEADGPSRQLSRWKDRFLAAEQLQQLVAQPDPAAVMVVAVPLGWQKRELGVLLLCGGHRRTGDMVDCIMQWSHRLCLLYRLL